MPEQDQVNFPPQPVRPRGGSGRSLAVRIGIVAGSAVLFVVGAVAVMGASPAPIASTTGADPIQRVLDPRLDCARRLRSGAVDSRRIRQPAPSADPGTQAPPAPNGRQGRRSGWVIPSLRSAASSAGSMGPSGHHHHGHRWLERVTQDRGRMDADDRRHVRHDHHEGRRRRSLVSDVQVGDQVRIAEKRNDDGTYTMTQIHVVMPTIGGQVTAIDGSTITVTASRRDDREDPRQRRHEDLGRRHAGREGVGHQGELVRHRRRDPAERRLTRCRRLSTADSGPSPARVGRAIGRPRRHPRFAEGVSGTVDERRLRPIRAGHVRETARHLRLLAWCRVVRFRPRSASAGRKAAVRTETRLAQRDRRLSRPSHRRPLR